MTPAQVAAVREALANAEVEITTALRRAEAEANEALERLRTAVQVAALAPTPPQGDA